MEWACNNCSVVNCNREFLCKTCRCARPTATRKIRPPSHVQRGKFIDKVVMNLVQKATKRKPTAQSSKSIGRVKDAIRKKAAQERVSPRKKRRETLMEKQFKAKADQIAKLTEELDSMRALVFQTSQSDYIQEQLNAIRNIGELIAKPSSSFAQRSSVDLECDNDSSTQHESNGNNDAETSTSETSTIVVEEDESSSTLLEKRKKYKRKEPFPYKCESCDFSCKSIWSFNSHLSSKHGQKDSFKCLEEDCEYSTSSKYFLDKHRSTEHCSLISNESVPIQNSKSSRKTNKQKKVALGKRKQIKGPPTMVNDIAKDVEMIGILLSDTDGEDVMELDDDRDSDWVPDESAGEESDGDDKPKNNIPLPPSHPCPSDQNLHYCSYDGCDYKTVRKSHMTRHKQCRHKEKKEKKEKKDKKKGKTSKPKDYKSRPKKPSAPRKKRVKEKKFSCDVCGAKATSMWYIKRHMRLHTGEKPFVCEYAGCNYRSYRKFHITRHVLNIHSIERPHQCEHCEYSAKTRENLRIHVLAKHSPDHYETCKYCDYRAKLKENVRSHIRSVHKFVCKDCSWEFSSDVDLADHLQRHQADGIICEVCSHVAKDIEEYKSHSLTEHGVELQTRIARKSRYFPVCEICNYQFSDVQSLEGHRVCHTANGAIICHFCGQVFKGMSALKDHTVVQHGFVIDAKPKPSRTYKQKFTCSTCNYEFNSRAALQSHCEQHRLDGSIKCAKCPHISMTMSDLMQHCLIIHGERIEATICKKRNLFRCKICKYFFPTASKLESHRSKHMDDGTILCGICKVKMPSMSEMKGHMMLMHGMDMNATEQQELTLPSKHICEVCGYVFYDTDQMNLHRSCHMADGSVCCTMCSYNCPNMEYLSLHMREIHHVELASERSPEADHKSKQLQVISKEVLKTPQLLHNVFLHGERSHGNAAAQPFVGDSYIRPPACVFDSTASTSISFDTQLQNSFGNFTSPTATVISNLSKPDNNFLSPNLPSHATISITNNNTKFVINNYRDRSALLCGGRNSKTDSRNFELDLASHIPTTDPLTQAVCDAGLSTASSTSRNTIQQAPKIKAVTDENPEPKAKAHPGIFM